MESKILVHINNFLTAQARPGLSKSFVFHYINIFKYESVFLPYFPLTNLMNFIKMALYKRSLWMKNEQLSNQIYKNKLPIRVDKTLAWLADSRDSWKEKCMQTKLQLKRQTLAIKRLKNGRTSWKLYSTRLKQELIQSKKMMSCLQEQVDEMEAQIENYKKEIQVVKKKH
jgi:hypothetical protein